MTEYHWVRTGPRRAIKEERRPYDKCPHCSRYKFVVERRYRSKLFGDSWYDFTQICRECKYTEDVPAEVKQQYQEE